MPRVSLSEATAEVAARDPAMASMIRRVGPFRLRPRVGEHFAALIRSIMYQQLAGKAAAAIHSRLLDLLNGTPTPSAVLALNDHDLRAAGLSAAKVASIRDLAAKVEDGTVPLDDFSRLLDDEIVRRLSSVRGIGRWTAEMFLIFELRRLDVWPVDDLAVRRGWGIIHGLEEPPKPKALDEEGELFRPYRTVAAWYCWRANGVPPGEEGSRKV